MDLSRVNCDASCFTRRAKWVSVVMSAEDYERLQRLGLASARSLAELLLQLPQDDEGFERMPLEPRDLPRF